MQKQSLLNRINDYDKSLKWYENRHNSIVFLRRFVRTKAISSRADDEQIYFSEFLEYLQKEYQFDLSFQDQNIKDYVTDKRALRLFDEFKKEIKIGLNKNRIAQDDQLGLLSLPNELICQILSSLSMKDLHSVTKTCVTLYGHKNLGNHFWIDKIKKLGCNKVLLEEVVKLGIIKNYRHVYQSLNHFLVPIKDINDPFILLCLSGEPDAIQHALMSAGSLPEAERNMYALCLVAHSGSIAGMEYLRKQGIDPQTRIGDKLTILHIAIMRNHLALMKQAVEHYHIPPVTIVKKSYVIFNPADSAIAFNHFEALKYLVKANDNSLWCKKTGWSLLHMSAYFNNVDMIRFIIQKYKLEVNAKDLSGMTALDIAARFENYHAYACLKQLGGELSGQARDLVKDQPKFDRVAKNIGKHQPNKKTVNSHLLLYKSPKGSNNTPWWYLNMQPTLTLRR